MNARFLAGYMVRESCMPLTEKGSSQSFQEEAHDRLKTDSLNHSNSDCNTQERRYQAIKRSWKGFGCLSPPVPKALIFS